MKGRPKIGTSPRAGSCPHLKPTSCRLHEATVTVIVRYVPQHGVISKHLLWLICANCVAMCLSSQHNDRGVLSVMFLNRASLCNTPGYHNEERTREHVHTSNHDRVTEWKAHEEAGTEWGICKHSIGPQLSINQCFPVSNSRYSRKEVHEKTTYPTIHRYLITSIIRLECTSLWCGFTLPKQRVLLTLSIQQHLGPNAWICIRESSQTVEHIVYGVLLPSHLVGLHSILSPGGGGWGWWRPSFLGLHFGGHPGDVHDRLGLAQCARAGLCTGDDGHGGQALKTNQRRVNVTHT